MTPSLKPVPDVEADFRPRVAIGLMSGTSMDGIDAALLITDGARIADIGPARSDPYDAAFRARLKAIVGRRHGDEAALADVARTLTDLHAATVRRLLDDAGRDAGDVDLIGFHGHTVFHQPKQGITLQIGDAQRLADSTGIPVVAHFRSADVRAGGEGAPLVPLFHAAMADALAKPLAVVNIGGVANVTWIGGSGELLAFDTGPGNALLDDWMIANTGQSMDAHGALARSGCVDEALVARWLSHPYFRMTPPKSLDRDAFQDVLRDIGGMSPADGAATLTRFSAASIAAAASLFPEQPQRWLITGGGRHNQTLMALLADAVAVPVMAVEAVGWNGDALEAQAFAFLAVRALRRWPLTLPTTTGVNVPLTGGTLHRPAAG